MLILEKEFLRRSEQARLDRLKTAAERNKWGQFATPPALALDIAKYAWSLVHRRKGRVRFLDPAIGTGSFFGAFLQAFPQDRIEGATGVELDPLFADAARSIWGPCGLQVLQGDFAQQTPPNADSAFNVLLTNPPYVRHHHLTAEAKQHLGQLAFSVTGRKLSGLAGLYCYFLLIAHAWLADRGLAVWLIPSEFMDVNYGEQVKRYLTEQVALLHIHRFSPSDVQFDDAMVSSAIVVFEKRKPEYDHRVVFSLGGTLLKPADSQEVELSDLRSVAKWSSLPRLNNNRNTEKRILLGDLFVVKRGLATGNNSFFILPKAKLQAHGIPLRYVRPILPSPRFLKQEVIESDENGWPLLDQPLALIDCPLQEEEVIKRYPKFWDYLEGGKKLGIHLGYLTSRRSPWYSQEKRKAAPLLCTYMGRSLERPFRFLWNKSQAIAANVYLLLYPKPSLARVLAGEPGLCERIYRILQAIHPEEFFSEGRVYGGGLYKMEPAELMRLPADEIAEILGIKKPQQLALFG